MQARSLATPTAEPPPIGDDLPEQVLPRSSPESPQTTGAAAGDPCRGVILVLFAAVVLGTIASYYGAEQLSDPVLYAVLLTLAIAGGILLAVAAAQMLRARAVPLRFGAETSEPSPEEDVSGNWIRVQLRTLRRLLTPASKRILQWIDRLGLPGVIGMATAVAGATSVGLQLRTVIFAVPNTLPVLGTAAGVCLAAAGLAATAARYLGTVDPEQLPEGAGLQRLARVVGWVLVLAAVSVVFVWANQDTSLVILFFLIQAVNAMLCFGLFATKQTHRRPREIFLIDASVLILLGSRPNILASILDFAERQLGIDIRSTWALTVVRRSLEPLVFGLALVLWLSTCLTVVAPDEQGLVERLGVPAEGPPLMPGLHSHLPWPIDKVFRVSAQRAQLIEIGHEGEEPGGPEDVLWARKHAENEYTLLLGNGRDLITVDAAIQFRIRDVHAWRYNSRNPADALRALGYRAVMRDTVNRTLADALSENVALLASHMRSVVQKDADALGLGVEILGFTVGGMHPPVTVARDYQAVVSAELRKVTAVVNAQAYRNQVLPAAEAAALVGANAARAEGEAQLSTAAGEAWSFRTLQSQYRAEPGEYLFRRRLETLEKGLAGRRFTVVDSRFERDGGVLWVIP